MLDKTALKETYDRVARDWHADHKGEGWWTTGTEKLISLLPKGAAVLDAGCGAGRSSSRLSEAGMKVLGIDFSVGQLALARKHAPDAEFRELDLYEVGNMSEQFDCVFAQASLLHIPKKDVRGVLDGLVSRLKPGGLLYVAVKEIRPDQPEEEIKKEDRYGGVERFFSYFTLPELQRYFQNLGLEIVYEDTSLTGNTNWIQLIGRYE